MHNTFASATSLTSSAIVAQAAGASLESISSLVAAGVAAPPLAPSGYWVSLWYAHDGREEPDQPDNSWDPASFFSGLPVGWGAAP